VFGRCSASVRPPTEHANPPVELKTGSCSDCSVDLTERGEQGANGYEPKPDDILQFERLLEEHRRAGGHEAAEAFANWKPYEGTLKAITSDLDLEGGQ
jgi:hypothetical protein